MSEITPIDLRRKKHTGQAAKADLPHAFWFIFRVVRGSAVKNQSFEIANSAAFTNRPTGYIR